LADNQEGRSARHARYVDLIEECGGGDKGHLGVKPP